MCPADLVHCCLGYTETLDFSFLLEFFQLLPGVFDGDSAINLHGHRINNNVYEVNETREHTRCW